MIGLEIILNGTRVCLAGAGEGVLSATVSSVPKRKELELEIGGLVDDAHLKWPAPRSLAIGDEVIVRIVDTVQPDPPNSMVRDDRALAEASERKYYERLKSKYEGKG